MSARWLRLLPVWVYLKYSPSSQQVLSSVTRVQKVCTSEFVYSKNFSASLPNKPGRVVIVGFRCELLSSFDRKPVRKALLVATTNYCLQHAWPLIEGGNKTVRLQAHKPYGTEESLFKRGLDQPGRIHSRIAYHANMVGLPL